LPAEVIFYEQLQFRPSLTATKVRGQRSLRGPTSAVMRSPNTARQAVNTYCGRRYVIVTRYYYFGHQQLTKVCKIATANVDFKSDEALQEALQSLPPSTTIIAIAHRAASLAWMDRILVLDAGKVKEDGTPLTLLEQTGGTDDEGKAIDESYYRASIKHSGKEGLRLTIETAKTWAEKRKLR
jgi:hypothetical protein